MRRGRLDSKTKKAMVAQILLLYICIRISNYIQLYIPSFTMTLQSKQNRRIAILSGYVNKDETQSKLPDHYMDHLLNKACYAHRHNYDLIFNTTWGFPDVRPRDGVYSTNSPYKTQSFRTGHLDFGPWHVVPYMEAALPKYDWVLWTDTDYVFQHMDTSIDQLIDEWENEHLEMIKDVHVLVSPGIVDPNNPTKEERFDFQSWAVLIRNSPFGHRVLHYWREFALGVCPCGNFKQKKYTWRISDQPGLWYALIKAHMEKFGNIMTANTTNVGTNDFHSSLLVRLGCNPQTGYLQVNDDPFPFEKEINDYFGHVFKNSSHSLSDILNFPSDQPILWSSENILVTGNSSYGVMGLGIDVEPRVGFWQNYKPGVTPIPELPHAFGLHVKRAFSPTILKVIETCQQEHHCKVGYSNDTSNSNQTTLVAKCGT